MMKKIILCLTAISLIAFIALGTFTAHAATTTIRIHGSNTLYPITDGTASAYHEENPDVEFEVGGEGSSVGVAMLFNEQTDIATSSRDLKASEIASANDTDMIIRVFIVALDGIAIIVNPANPITQITQQQITDIYNGTITKWSDLGVDVDIDGIKVLERDENSGTHEFFNEFFMNKKEVDSTKLFDYGQYQSTSEMFSVVASEVNTIAYGGLGYVTEDVKALDVSDKDGANFAPPSVATVQDGSYAVNRPLYFFTDGEPTGSVKDYIDFVFSYEGQTIVFNVGFIPVGDYDETGGDGGLRTSFGYVAIPLALGIIAYTVMRRRS